MDLDARPYRCFIAVAETGSFRRAATLLHLSQPALSAQIRELERRLGFALFTRSSRAVAITSQGHLFLPNARRIVAETDIISRAAFDIRTNQLRIGAPLYTALIPERAALIEQFMATCPAVPLSVLNDGHARNLAALRARETDLVLAILPGPPGREWTEEEGIPSSIEWLAVAERPIELSLPIDHPLAVHDVIPTAALHKLRVARVGRFHGRQLSDAVSQRLIELGAEPIRPPEGNAISVEHYAGIMGIAAVALGWLSPDLLPGPPRVRRRVADLGLSSCLALIRNRGAQRPAADAFWQLAMEVSDRNF